MVLGGGSHLLQQAKWLIEIDWHCDLRHIFPNRVLKDGPNADLDFGIFEERKTFSLLKVPWVII